VSRFTAILVLAGLMALARWGPLQELAQLGHQATVSLGFVLIFGYLVGHFARRVYLPRITGYILAGVLCGPYVGGLLTGPVVKELQLIDDLALALIAFTAGGELRVESLRPRLRSIFSITLIQTLVLFFGMAGGVLLLASHIPFLAGQPFLSALAAACVFGLIGMANSPSTTVALINEYGTRGPFAGTILGVTVLKDVAVLVLITLLLPLIQVLAFRGGAVDIGFVQDLVWEIGGSLVGGVALGYLVTLYIRGVGAVLPLFIVGISVLVSQVAHQFHLEALLLCMVAGFVIENATSQGDRFIQAIERSALPVYVVFFAIGGASLDLGAVRTAWVVTLSLFALRTVLVWVSTVAGERLSGGGNRAVIRYGWLGFLAQAGVTLGLASIVARKFPEWGPEVKTIALALIAVNQLVGPVGFRFALLRSGEAREAGTRVLRRGGSRSIDTSPPSS
jgi:Kef-type K+ transport system membrane component KefB